MTKSEESAEAILSWGIKHWKLVGVLGVGLAAAITLANQVKSHDNVIKTLQNDSTETKKLFAGQEQINNGQEKINNLLVEMIRTEKRYQWSRRPDSADTARRNSRPEGD